MDATISFALGALALAAAAVAVWLWRRLTMAEEASRRLAADVETGQEILAAAPDGIYSWDLTNGREHCSRRLAVLLDLPAGSASRFDEVLSRFAGNAAESLKSAVTSLRGEGRAFDLVMPLAGGGRTVHVLGVRAAAADGRPLADLLWMRDVNPSPAAGAGNPHDTEAGTEAGWQTLLQALPLPAWLRDADQAVVFANAESAAAAVAEPARALAQRAHAEKRELSAPIRVNLNGATRVLEITEAPLPGRPGTIGFAADPALKGPQPELPLHVDVPAEVLEKLPAAIAIFAADTRIKFYNGAFVQLWGLDKSWLALQPDLGQILERLREQRRLPEVADFRTFKEQQLAQFGQLRTPAQDLMHLPDDRTVESVVSPASGGGLIFTFEDVSERLTLERSYNTLIAVQRATLDNLYEGVAVFGSDGKLRLHNPSLARIWKLDEAFLGAERHVSDFAEAMKPLLAETGEGSAETDAIAARLMSREPRTGRLVRGDGTILEHAGVPLPDGAVLLSYLDVTDSARVEMALRERAGALQEADRLKSEFIANVSYEIRIPLNTIMGFSHLLTEEYFGKLNRRQKEYSRGIMESSEGLMSVVNDILDLASIEAGMMTLELDTVEVHTMLVGVLALIRERARSKKLDVQFDCPTDIGWIVADERRLKQVVFNLLSNAIAFTPADGRVGLAARREKDEVLIAVSDSGPGIPAGDQDWVFGTFERGNAPETQQGGAGLGLSLVRSFVELHGGRVSLKSGPKKGTTITCALPADAQDGSG